MDGMSMIMDAMVMRTGLTAVNVTMLTSSSGMRCRVKIQNGGTAPSPRCCWMR